MAFNGKNRNGNGDSDVDGQLGNSFQSPSYARHYDPTGEIFANRSELPTHIRELNEAQRIQQNREIAARRDAIARKAQSAVHFKYDFGKFIIPAENTWAAHSKIVRDDQTQLGFNPSRYPIFDKIIAQRSGLKPLYDPSHRDYAKYEGLRTNLEVLRNDIIGFYMHDGSFDPGDEQYIPHITAIATAIGDGLRNDTLIGRVLSPSIRVDVANVEAVGAAEIYTFLLGQQSKSRWIFDTVIASLRSLLHMPDRSWHLPPIENTPFSPKGLSAPPPAQPLPPEQPANEHKWREHCAQELCGHDIRNR